MVESSSLVTSHPRQAWKMGPNSQPRGEMSQGLATPLMGDGEAGLLERGSTVGPSNTTRDPFSTWPNAQRPSK